jgi:CDP-paratose 2-epimerase
LSSNLKHEVFNIGGGPNNTLSLLELLEVLKKMTGLSPRVSFAEWRPADQKVYVSDINKARALLRWEPKTSVEDGIRRLIKWILENMGLLG